jgi:hypothetical protein
MDFLPILVVVFFVVIIIIGIRRSITTSTAGTASDKKPRNNVVLPKTSFSSWPSWSNGTSTAYRDHPWGTTTLEPGDLTKIEETLGTAPPDKEE